MALKLMAEVALDGSGFERGLHRIGHAATHNLKSLVVGAFGVYSIHQAIHKTVETAEELVTASRRLNITVEQLQVMRQAAKENGVEFGKLAGAFERLNVAREKALGSGPTAAKAMAAFARLGVSADQLRSQSAAQLFSGPIRQKVMGSDSQDIIKPLRDIFGRGGGELIPLLKVDFEELQHKMENLGSIMSTETAVKLRYLADEFGLLSNIIALQTGPALLSLAEIIFSFVGKWKATSSYWGSLTSNIIPPESAKAVFGDKGYINSLIDNIGSMFSDDKITEAEQAYMETESGFQSGIDKIKEELAKAAERLKNPGAPPGPPGPDSPEKRKKALKMENSDALVRVGNFLGQSKDALSRLQERQVDLLQQIADNTEPRGFMDEDAGFPI